MGLLSGIGHAAKGLFSADGMDRMARAQAFLGGDYADAAQIGELMRERGIQQQQQEQAQQRQAQLHTSLTNMGYSPDQINALMTDPKAIANITQSQLETKQFGPGGGSLYNPVGDQWTNAPRSFEANNGDQYRTGPDGATTRTFQDPTPKTEMIQVKDPATGRIDFYRVPVGGAAQGTSQSYSELPPGYTVRQQGGPTPSASGGFPDPMKAPGTVTSGRRTREGNKAVGGVPTSYHVTGDAADYVGTSPAALRQYFGPGVKIIPESDHLHVQARGLNAPYYGRQGTIGLRR